MEEVEEKEDGDGEEEPSIRDGNEDADNEGESK